MFCDLTRDCVSIKKGLNQKVQTLCDLTGLGLWLLFSDRHRLFDDACGNLSKHHRGEVPLCQVGQYNDNGFAGVGVLFRESNRCSCGSTTGDADQETFLLSQAKCHGDRLLIGDLLDLVDHRQVEVLGNEACTDALDLVGPWLDRFAIHGLRDHRAVGWFDRNGFNRLSSLVLDVAGDAGDRAAGADAGHEDINGAVAVAPDFRAGGLFVNLGVRWVVELTGHEIFRGIALGDLLGFGDGARHAFCRFGEHDFSTEDGHDPSPFDRHRLRHRQDQLVTPCCGRVGEGDAGVPRRGLNDHLVLGERPAFLRIPDHVGADAALHAVRGIAPFNLGQHRGLAVFGDVVQFHQRGVANGEAVVVVNAGHDASE